VAVPELSNIGILLSSAAVLLYAEGGAADVVRLKNGNPIVGTGFVSGKEVILEYTYIS
jgi:hypothetical protein